MPVPYTREKTVAKYVHETRSGRIFAHRTFFNVIFVTEMCIKVVALGFFWGKGSYLQDNWNKCAAAATPGAATCQPSQPSGHSTPFARGTDTLSGRAPSCLSAVRLAVLHTRGRAPRFPLCLPTPHVLSGCPPA